MTLTNHQIFTTLSSLERRIEKLERLSAAGSPISYEISKHPHPKLPNHLKDQIMPDVIWLIYRGGLQLGWQSDDPSKENVKDMPQLAERNTQTPD